MSEYRYRAARTDGERVSGVAHAPSAAAALGDLTGRGLFVLELREAEPARDGARRLPRCRRGP